MIHFISFYDFNPLSLGYCLIAISLLPIRPGSLKYGSSDGGLSVLTDDPALNQVRSRIQNSLLNININNLSRKWRR